MTRQFSDLVASELYCPRCRQARPVRERLLLVLPTGELYEYRCAECASSLGQRTVTEPPVRKAAGRPGSRARPGRAGGRIVL